MAKLYGHDNLTSRPSQRGSHLVLVYVDGKAIRSKNRAGMQGTPVTFHRDIVIPLD
jgi:hypothetical protein